jgi:FkbM family methyltransferase
MSLTQRGRVLRGVTEDPDFDERFRRQRIRRWLRGIRNGMSAGPLARFRLGLGDDIRFQGVTVQQSPNQATLRLIEDIWMRGEYDIPGYVPQRGWRVIDIGANVGIYAMLAASRGARVVAYEPEPGAFGRLSANTARWNVECHQAAVVGAPRQAVTLFLHPLRDTRNTLFGRDGGICNISRTMGVASQVIFENSIEVAAVPIAAVLGSPCDLLKVACEGAEFEIFAHARGVLRNAGRIVIELHGEMRTDHGSAQELAFSIRDAGYSVEVLQPYPGTSRQFLTATRR